jgi:FlaA1/EpsC-like NDP-sugar epimerase
MIALAWVVALCARFNFAWPPPEFLAANLRALPVVVAVQGALAWYFRLYRGLWRFASLQDLWNIVRSAALGAFAVALALFVVTRLEQVPRSVLVLYPMFLTFFLGGPRLLYRLAKDRSLNLNNIRNGERILIVGAGTGGEMLVRDILRDGNYVPVGFVDDRAGLARMRIHGIPVLGGVDRLPDLVRRYQVDRVFIAIPSATNAQMQRIVGVCERAGCPFRTLPRLQDLVAGRVGLREVREVAIDDLLGRSAVQLDWAGIQRPLLGQTVLVTGGGGSIGAELCRQVARLGVGALVIYERSEYQLYRVERELRQAFPHLALHALLGDVCDAVALEHAFAAHRPKLVFHAAAYKHVPIVEAQIREGVRNNVLGTCNVVDAADRHGCEALVLISTDKAVRPSSAMGATKRFAELLCERKNLQSKTRFVTVRFGNVLGSAGSVVPLFREQIRHGGPITVTHPEASRYFMTIPEACQLILQAAAVGSGGDIFVLDMGEPVNINYLAEQMIRLSGHVPGEDIRIVYTGLRPGEKLSEELFHAEENLRSTPHPKLLLAAQTRLDPGRIAELYVRLMQACDAFDEKKVREVLTEAVPELSDGDGRGARREPTVVLFKRSVT